MTNLKGRKREGQAMVEYGFKLGLIAVAVLAALAILGPRVRDMLQTIADKCDEVLVSTGGGSGSGSGGGSGGSTGGGSGAGSGGGSGSSGGGSGSGNSGSGSGSGGSGNGGGDDPPPAE